MFVCVGTPPTYSGDADLSAVWNVVDQLPEQERALAAGDEEHRAGRTGEKVREALDSRGLAHVGYVSNPEFLAEGSAVEDFMRPDRVVVGSFAEADGETVAALYEPLAAPIVRTDVASAEMIKLAANAFLMTRISFINEIANVCEVTGADVVKVAEGIGLDHRLGPHFLRAGIGWGGSCFPKDGVALKQLASNSGYHFQLLNAVIEVNELQKRRVIGKLEKHLGKLRGKTIALLGLAFKPNTDDLREAPSLVLASRLLAEGAEVRAWDPVADARRLLQGVTFCDTVLGGGHRRRRCGDRHGMGRAALARIGRGARRDGDAGDHRRPQPARPGGGPRRRLHLRGHRPGSLASGRASGDGRARAASSSSSGGDHPGRRQGRAARRRRARPAEGAGRGGREAAGRVPGRAARGGRRRPRARQLRRRQRGALRVGARRDRARDRRGRRAGAARSRRRDPLRCRRPARARRRLRAER